MNDYSAFDILGPIMIGPSSSHTAGAARLGKIARDIASKGFNKVKFYLHGSFAKTYKGHGTDKALVAGILGIEPEDERLKDSFDLAKEANIEIEFIEADLGYQHPNTVKIVFTYPEGEDFYVLGSSIGGGNVIVYDINGDLLEFTGSYPTMLIKYPDQKGIISKVSSIVSNGDINIATMKVTRENKVATMLCEFDVPLQEDMMDEIKNMKELTTARFINVKRG